MECPVCSKDIQPESVSAFYFDVMKWQCLDCGIVILKSELSYPDCALQIKKELALIKRRMEGTRSKNKPYKQPEGGEPDAKLSIDN